MSEFAMGMVGLGVMGKNLALNMAEKGFSVAGYDAWPEQVHKFTSESPGLPVQAFSELSEFVASLARPRRIVLLVKAGKVVDDTIRSLVPLLQAGDLLVDAGNEHFTNTERRARDLVSAGVRFFGMGVSGGEEGARHGPSMMPGGDRSAYDELAPVLTKIAAQVDDGPCVAYIGPGGAGHYVKMVHNGIEYGDMQLIAEAYGVLKNVGGIANRELAEIFEEWNEGELESFLIEISARIFRVEDPETGGDLIDMILDTASMKGTGKWTVQDASEIGVAIPTIAAAVDARLVSALKSERVTASKQLAGPPAPTFAIDKKQLIADVRAALYAAKCCSYAQGMQLIQHASSARAWAIPLAELARIWKAGCIIRARLLGRIQAAYAHDPGLPNLLLDPSFTDDLRARQRSWREVIALGSKCGVPLPATAASLFYYDSNRNATLPANLIQAQRDFFGAHGYERVDRPGTFHTDWSKSRPVTPSKKNQS